MTPSYKYNYVDGVPVSITCLLCNTVSSDDKSMNEQYCKKCNLYFMQCDLLWGTPECKKLEELREQCWEDEGGAVKKDEDLRIQHD